MIYLDTRLKCLIIDDELPGLKYLKMLCEQIPQLEVVKAFNSPNTLLKEISGLVFDFCIMDIEMPEMNGLQLSNLLNGKPVIFATAYKEYAAEAFDLNAIDYIRKPIQLERLRQAIQKVENHLKKYESTVQNHYIQLNTDQGKSILYLDTISYVKTSAIDSRDKIAQLIDGQIIVLKNITFDKLLSELPPDGFCRINKSEVLSLKAVRVIAGEEITTNMSNRDGKILKLVLSDLYRNEFLQKLKLP